MATFRGLFVRKDSTRGVQPAEARLALAGLLTPSGDIAALPGVISGLTVRGVAGQWYYAIDGGHSTTVRAATDGANLPGLDGVTNTPATADNTGASLVAPGSGSRWDLIWIRQRDVDNADADSASVLGVTSSTASGSPTKRYDLVPAGALVLAEAQVGAGATGTLDASVVITQVAPRVGVRGGVIPVSSQAQRDLLTSYATAANPITVFRTGLGIRESNYGSGWYGSSVGPWQTYTPTVTGVSLGTGSATAVWRREGDLIRVRPLLTWGTSATGSQPRISLPVPSATLRHPFEVVGCGSLSIAGGAQIWKSIFVLANTTTAQINYETSGALLDIAIPSTPGPWASGDVMTGEFTYRAA